MQESLKKFSPELLKKFSPAVFGIALICFFLPWVNLSCQGQHIASLTGLQLVTGMTIHQAEGMFSKGKEEKLDSEPLAVVVLISTILGFALSFLKSRKSSLITSIVGFVGFILLLLLKSKIDNAAISEGQGIIQIGYAIGFWLLLLLFIGAIALNSYLYFGSKKQVQTLPPQTPET